MKEHKKITLAAGPQFKASGWKEFWWGKHWRKEWITPVSFPYLDLDTTAGGLTPLKMGGGHETKSLRLLGKNGREYVLRTVDKNLDVLIPEQFKESFVSDILNDQVSVAHPYGPLVAASLAGSIGIMHTNPVILFVPDNSRLGEFRKVFANKLCLFEERANGDGWTNTELTGYADEIVNSDKLFEKLEEDNRKHVDQKEYLKVRLFDMFINDWDRHEDQWVWAGHKNEGKVTYEAFARDRDQSLSRSDGVNLYFLSRPWAIRSIQNFQPDVKDVIGTSLSATALDKQFTNELTETDWRNIIDSLQKLLTDTAIKEALLHMPPEIYAISGEFIFQRLQSRRNDMMDFGMRYYKIINKEITITGTNEKEFFTINRPGGANIEITVQALSKKDIPKDTLFHRIFNHSVTKEINIYGLGGDDKFIYEGNSNNNILVRTFGNDGNDQYIDSAQNKISKTKIYDVSADAPSSSTDFNYHATGDTSVTNYDRKWFKYDWWAPSIFPSYNPDDGVLIGAGFKYKKQKWNKTPFGWEQAMGGTYAFATGAFSIFYKGIFKQTFGKWDLDVAANYKAPSYVVSFYGYGNDAKLLVKDKAFYRTRLRSLHISPAVSRSWKKNIFKTGLVYNTFRVEQDKSRILGQVISGIDSSVFQDKYFGGANVSYTYNTSNSFKYPTKGIIIDAGSSYFVNLKESNRNFLNLQGSFTFYYSPFKKITLAHRTGAATNFGDYEYYQANTLGGSENLRGYWRTRFTGRTCFYQNTDVRWLFARLKGNILRGGLGLYGFFDDGRVWIKDEDSKVFHTGYGGGIYFIPFGALALNVFYATSKEVNVFTVKAGFLF